MISPLIEDIQIIRYARSWGYSAHEWEASLGRIDWFVANGPDRPECLKERADGSGSVWRAQLSIGMRRITVVLKTQAIRTGSEMVRSYLKRTPLNRQWRGASVLAAHGLAPARCRVLMRGRNGTGLLEVLILEACPGRTLLEELSNPDLHMQRRVDRLVGDYLARLVQSGLINRDTKPSNLIVQIKSDSSPVLRILDTVAIRKSSRALEHLDRMFRDLLLEPIGCGFSLSASRMMRVLRTFHSVRGLPGWKQFRDRHWDAVHQMVLEHGDPTPEDPPVLQADDA